MLISLSKLFVHHTEIKYDKKYVVFRWVMEENFGWKKEMF